MITNGFFKDLKVTAQLLTLLDGAAPSTGAMTEMSKIMIHRKLQQLRNGYTMSSKLWRSC